MKITDLTNEQFLEIQTNFLSTSQDISFFSKCVFLQSLDWANIQRSDGQDVFLKKVEDQGYLVAFFIVIEKKISGGKKYWYIPRGPIIITTDFSWDDFFFALREDANKKGIIFIRLEPIKLSFLDYMSNKPKDIKKTKDIQPSHTSFLNLDLGVELLLKNMAQKTRYNIRLAEKKGVKIIESDIKDFDDFWRLMSLTSTRDQFSIHSREYYRHLIETGGDFIKLYMAKLGDKTLAVGLFSFFADTVSYLHGASDNNMRNVMAPYLLQWEIIKKAQAAGFKYYDFYGVDDKKWPGVSRFKRGFSGNDFSFPGTYDVVVNRQVYGLYQIIRKINFFIHHI